MNCVSTCAARAVQHPTSPSLKPPGSPQIPFVLGFPIAGNGEEFCVAVGLLSPWSTKSDMLMIAATNLK